MADDGKGLDAKDREAVAKLRSAFEAIKAELRKVIVGQDQVVDELLIAIFSRGHCILEGVPGLAKTLLISTLARAIKLKFSRVQFTPDLMPSDITGTEVIQENKTTGERELKFIPGPIFANFVLADEINRTPPKTQAALLEAMQERQVTAGGTTYKLPPPFLVFATQNPIEQEGTYPLPEAQLDRFMFSIAVDYPTFDEEVAIVTRTTGQAQEEVKPVLGAEDLARFQDVVLGINAAPALVRYAVEVATRTRPVTAAAPRMVKDYVAWGAGPRASQYLILGAKARAALLGRTHVSHDDIDALAPAVLGHRVLVNFQAEAERIGARDVVAEVLRSASSSR